MPASEIRWTVRFRKGDSVSSPIVTVGGGNQVQLSRKAIEDAGADADHLVKNSAVVNQLVSVDIFSRQLFMLVRAELDREVTEGWHVENPSLVIQMLGRSAECCAVKAPISAHKLRDDLLGFVLPVLDILCKVEDELHDNQSSTESTSASVHRRDDIPSSGLGQVPSGANCDTLDQAGQRGEGN